MSESAQPVLRFLNFVLDGRNARLSQGQRVLALRPKTFAVLEHLAASPGRLVTKREMLDAVWPGIVVTDWVLTSCIRELHEALGDDARRPTVVETVHGRGYRFVAAVGPQAPASGTGRSPSDETSISTGSDELLVGRADEMQTLRECWRRACSGERQILFVMGEPGIGKTTLTERFLGELAAGNTDTAPPLIARGQCVEQYGAGEPYLPVLEALERLCRIAVGVPLVEILRRHAPSWLVQLPGLLSPEECEALERRLGAASRTRMLREIATLVASLPAPLVLVLEDLHWSDHATIDVLTTVAQRRDPARLLLVGTYRPVDAAVRSHPLRSVHLDLRGHGRCKDLWVRPLTESDVMDYLRARWPRLADIGTLAKALHERSDGNPCS